jgi:DNA sulfur modification protein DndC
LSVFVPIAGPEQRHWRLLGSRRRVWYALAELPPERRQKRVFVIASDTFVETPVIVDHIDENLEAINREAERQGMPFQAQKVVPELEDTFWVNLLGRGYPAPSSRFRWCTDRMKIQPADKFILSRVAEDTRA